METTYDVRIWKTEVREGRKVKGKRPRTSYRVRWLVAGKRKVEPFTTSTLAESFRSDLIAATRKGEAFFVDSGLPVSMKRAVRDMSWYDLACKFVDLKWPKVAATTRRTHAEALTPATIAMLSGTRGKPDALILRTALCRWGFNTNRRDDPNCPAEIRSALKWVAANTRPVAALTDPTVLRPVIDAVTSKLDGKPAAPSVASRRRKILNTTLEYAANELKVLHANPMPGMKVTAPAVRGVRSVDRRSVANPVQARCLLGAVGREHLSERRLAAYFGCQYFAALRPEEAVSLNKSDLSLPPVEWDEDAQQWTFTNDGNGWGELHLGKAEPHAGKDWTDSGANRDSRQLKQREIGETRPVPCCPELTVMLYEHMRIFGTAPDGRLFVGQRNHSELPKGTIIKAWDRARRAVFTDEVYAGPLAKTPYDLRHAAVSTWLNGGVPATRVSMWAGHSVEILLKIYAKCLDGEDAALRARVEAALGR